jgi:murein peptide amidase A
MARDVPAAAGPAVDAALRSRPRRVLVLGAIHGDELTATTLAMNWLAAADQAAPQAYSRRIDWRFVPVVNPDGVLGLKPSRTNARGVDLNRNFPTPDWAVLAPKWWQESTRRDPRRFPGPQALSEPESRWVHDEMAAWQPDLIVSIHAPFGVLDFDGPVEPPERIGRLWLDPVGTYPGSLGNYGGLGKGVSVLTIELPHALKPPSEAEMQGMWHDMLAWIEGRWRPPPTAADAAPATPAH